MEVTYTAESLFYIIEQFLMDGLEDGKIISEGKIYTVNEMYLKAEQYYMLDGQGDKKIKVDLETIHSLNGIKLEVLGNFSD